MKTCPRCGESKTLDQFPPRTVGGVQSVQSYCRPCMTDYRREWRDRPESAAKMRTHKVRFRQSHLEQERAKRRERYTREDKDANRERQRAWVAANPDKIKRYARDEGRRWARMKYAHGIGRDEYVAILNGQDGRCPVCLRHLPIETVRKGDDALRPHVDHNHQTGAVRGILCGPCNQGIGLLAEDPERFQRAAAYLA